MDLEFILRKANEFGRRWGIRRDIAARENWSEVVLPAWDSMGLSEEPALVTRRSSVWICACAGMTTCWERLQPASDEMKWIDCWFVGSSRLISNRLREWIHKGLVVHMCVFVCACAWACMCLYMCVCMCVTFDVNAYCRIATILNNRRRGTEHVFSPSTWSSFSRSIVFSFAAFAYIS